MNIDVGQVLAELGTTAAIVAVLVWVLKPFIDRLMDNLDRQAQTYVEHMKTQVKASVALESLCRRFDEVEDEHRGRAATQDGRQRELREAQNEIVGALRGLQHQFQAHEGRAALRHEQQQKQSREQHAQQLEQGKQVVNALKALNGHKD